jgi:formylglycine-generating enzyme required for sulfatase activity
MSLYRRATGPYSAIGEYRMTSTPNIALTAMLLLITAIGCNSAAPPTPAALAPPVPADPTPYINSIGMTFNPVTPGEFIMGSPPDETGHDADETQHKVRLTKSFLLSVYQVTQSEYSAVMGTNPSYFRGDDLPVESISWDEAAAFCKKLSELEGKTYRLPSEAEWEYACRAGSSGPYAGDGNLDDIGWYLGNSGSETHPVGSLQPNAWGFYDMQGNVWEWCADWYGPYAAGDATDPTGPPTGTTRVLRGGSLDYGPEFARAAFRNWYTPETKLYYIGFRVVLDAP